MIVIDFKNFQINVQSRALLSPLTYQIHRGDQILLTSASGTGKTSLFEAMIHQKKHHQGSFKVHGSIAYLPQSLDLIRSASALDNVLSGTLGDYSWYETIFGYPKDEIEKAQGLLKNLEIKDSSKKIFELSGGEQQRVALARLMMTSKDILLLDEPFSQLDDKSALIFFKLFKSWVTENNLTMICILHQKQLFTDYFQKQLMWDQEWLS